MAAETEYLEITLWMSEDGGRVVYADADGDFVETLFSFLTMPLGKIVSLLSPTAAGGPQQPPALGCMGNLHGSARRLGKQGWLRTAACQSMLLSPRSASEAACEQLRINPQRACFPNTLYACPSPPCLTGPNAAFSTVPGTLCPCGRTMSRAVQQSLEMKSPEEWLRKRAQEYWDGGCGGGGGDEDGGVFLRGGAGFRYLVTDDLHVTRSSTAGRMELLQRPWLIKIADPGLLTSRRVKLGRGEVWELLERSLVSTTPLSDVFAEKKSLGPSPNVFHYQHIRSLLKIRAAKSETRITIKLIHDKAKKKVVYAEAGEDFVDLIFSFLVLPLGSVKQIAMGIEFGCVDNLYRSVCLLHDHLVPNRRFALTVPELMPHHRADKDMLLVEEMPHELRRDLLCGACSKGERHESADPPVDPPARGGVRLCAGSDKCGETSLISLINPKTPVSSGQDVRRRGGGYVKGPSKFLVTDDMRVAPYSSTSALELVAHIRDLDLDLG
uniref:Uncharacterized protein n=1 Tax=Ananas comosus var. bracteatus TaxID=296719 RepID=A0A6V7QAK0_ANACO|nr:unnamed protein product [Ananas comosus var. bracteatus]